MERAAYPTSALTPFRTDRLSIEQGESSEPAQSRWPTIGHFSIRRSRFTTGSEPGRIDGLVESKNRRVQDESEV